MISRNSAKYFVFVIVIQFVMVACDRPGKAPSIDDFVVGMTQQTIIADHGAPSSKTSIVKSADHVFGSIETFWSTVATGESIDIWKYPTKGGMIELYFVDGPDLKGKSFAPEGAVY